MQIAALYPRPAVRSRWIRTGETTAVPSLLDAEIHLIDPPVVVRLLIEVADDGRSRVCEFQVTPASIRDSVTTSMLRKLPIDELVRRTLERATRADLRPRPDIHPGAYQLSTDPEHQAWVSPEPQPGGRGRAVPGSRVRRAAEIYQQAVANGDKAPTEAVAREMGYSRPTAARDVRAAREMGLLPATAGMAARADDAPADNPLPSDAASGHPVWRSLGDQNTWAPIDVWARNADAILNNPESVLQHAVATAAALGADDPQGAGEAAVRARGDAVEADFPSRTGIGPSDLHPAAIVLYERTVGAELAARVAAGQDEDAALAQIAAEIRAAYDKISQ